MHADPVENLPSIHSRKLDVEQNKIGKRSREHSNELLASRGTAHIISFSDQRGREDRDDVRLVFTDQYPHQPSPFRHPRH